MFFVSWDMSLERSPTLHMSNSNALMHETLASSDRENLNKQPKYAQDLASTAFTGTLVEDMAIPAADLINNGSPPMSAMPKTGGYTQEPGTGTPKNRDPGAPDTWTDPAPTDPSMYS